MEWGQIIVLPVPYKPIMASNNFKHSHDCEQRWQISHFVLIDLKEEIRKDVLECQTNFHSPHFCTYQKTQIPILLTKQFLNNISCNLSVIKLKVFHGNSLFLGKLFVIVVNFTV